MATSDTDVKQLQVKIDEQTTTIKQLEETITELEKSKGELQSGINMIASKFGKHVEKTPDGILQELNQLLPMLVEIAETLGVDIKK